MAIDGENLRRKEGTGGVNSPDAFAIQELGGGIFI